jgi:outer membrane protein
MEIQTKKSQRMKIVTFVICMLFLSDFLSAQQNQFHSLEDIIQQAQSKSPRHKLAQTKKEISLYQYQTFKSNLKPQVFFNGNLPIFAKEYFGVRQPDGTIIYQSISQNNSNVGFSLSQQLPFSGGELSLNTDLARFDDFKAKTKQYTGTPIN